MPREVDPKRTRKALRQVRKLATLQETGDGAAPPPDYSGWEKEFLSEVEARLDKYGSAFADLAKGAPDEALSRLQAQKLKEIERKAKDQAAGKEPRRSGFKRKQPPWAKPASRDDGE
jgi:hypothetical protein